MTSEQIEKIFLPFEQASVERPRRAKGTGLGLAISRRLVNLMGSELEVESQPGQGTTFWFDVELPVVAMDTAPIQEARPTIRGYEGLRRTVLVADDTQHNRDVLVNLLDRLGFDVVTAEDGQQAIEQARNTHPDLILMDLVMPGIDGSDDARNACKENDENDRNKRQNVIHET